MSRLENGLKLTVLTQSTNSFLSDTLKVIGFTVSTPKSYDEYPRQVKYGGSLLMSFTLKILLKATGELYASGLLFCHKVVQLYQCKSARGWDLI